MAEQLSLNTDFYKLAEALKSLGHSERIAILNLLCNCKHHRMTVKSIYENLELEQSIVSRHLGIMKRAGILKKEMEGKKTYYFLNGESPVCEFALRIFNK